jgi:hypothetical protein
MTDTDPQQPISPDPPAPTGQDARAPEIEVDRPDDRAVPDSMGVNDDAAAVEAPD